MLYINSKLKVKNYFIYLWSNKGSEEELRFYFLKKL